MLVTNILAVYRGYPVMIVAKTEEGVLLELSLNELADVYELLPPALWQALVQHYQIFHVFKHIGATRAMISGAAAGFLA